MKYAIRQCFIDESVLVLWVKLGGVWFRSTNTYTTRRAAVRGAKRAGGTEEIK